MIKVTKIKLTKKLIFSVFLWLLSSTVFALGFGTVKVYSYLNDNLDAEIELLAADNLEVNDLKINLASNSDFELAGIQRESILNFLQLNIHRINKTTYLRLTSTNPIKDPFLDFLLELTWKEGRLIRSYTIIIDPPPLSGRPVLNNRFSDQIAVSDERSKITTTQRIDVAPNPSTVKDTKPIVPPLTIPPQVTIDTTPQLNQVPQAPIAPNFDAVPSTNIDENLKNLFEPEKSPYQPNNLIEQPKVIIVPKPIEGPFEAPNPANQLPAPQPHHNEINPDVSENKSGTIISPQLSVAPLNNNNKPIAPMQVLNNRNLPTTQSDYDVDSNSLFKNLKNNIYKMFDIPNNLNVSDLYNQYKNVIYIGILFLILSLVAVRVIRRRKGGDNVDEIELTLPKSSKTNKQPHGKHITDNEINLKLELAEGYMEIHDQVNAKLILEEVLKHGSEESRSKAQALLDQLKTSI